MQNTKTKQDKINSRRIITIQNNAHFQHDACGRHFTVNGMLGKSASFKQVLDQIKQVAKTDAAVILTGETGVGKNLVARTIHDNSTRKGSDFITVQCSSLTENLMTSELFGHEKGAFTGAIGRQIGRFEMADKGTIFLDEIGELSHHTQSLLLRVLQTKEFERVGGGKDILKSDFRLITATNQDLHKEVLAKRFREDLFYRINIFPIHIPPLRERREDIPILAQQFLFRYNNQNGKHFNEIPQEVIEQLIEYDWPGNIRELENVIQRSIIISHEPHFTIRELKSCGSKSAPKPEVFPSLAENEIQHIKEALCRTRGKIHGASGAAELLKVNPSTLTSRMRKFGIKRR